MGLAEIKSLDKKKPPPPIAKDGERFIVAAVVVFGASDKVRETASLCTS